MSVYTGYSNIVELHKRNTTLKYTFQVDGLKQERVIIERMSEIKQLTPDFKYKIRKN